MDLNNVIIAGDAAYRLRITVCTNDETLGDNLGFMDSHDREDIARDVVDAAATALDSFGLGRTYDGWFPNWHGSTFCNPLDLGCFPVFALAYSLEWDEESQSWDEGDHATSSAVLQNIMDALMAVVRAAVDKAVADAVEMYSAIESETED